MEAGRIGFYGGLFQQGSLSDTEYHTVLRVTAIHEFAHKIHLANSACPTNHDIWCITEEWFTDTEISMADWQARRVTALRLVLSGRIGPRVSQSGYTPPTRARHLRIEKIRMD